MTSDRRLDAARRVLEWGTTHDLRGLPGMTELESLAQFLGSRPTQETSDVARLRQGDSDSTQPRAYLVRAKSGDFSALEEELDALVHGAGEGELYRQLEALWRSLTIHHRVPFLEALTAQRSGGSVMQYHARIILKTLETCLVAWRNSTAVQRWVSAGIGRFLERHLFVLVLYDYYRADNLEAVSTLLRATVPQAERIGTLLSSLLARLERFDPAQIYLIVGEMMAHLPSEEAFNTLMWSLDRFEARSEVETSPQPPENRFLSRLRQRSPHSSGRCLDTPTNTSGGWRCTRHEGFSRPHALTCCASC